MGTEETLDEVLEHYGIKGMKWGVRRSREQLARARGDGPVQKARAKRSAKKAEIAKRRAPSPEAKEKADALAKAKKDGVHTLSNKELQALNKRLNLEKNYKELTTKPKTKSKGEKIADDIIKTEKAVSETYKFLKSPAGVFLIKTIKEKLKS
jgi:hypothetical protein